MQDLIQETARGIAIVHDTYGSAHTAEWVNMENHAKITFTVITGGTATAGVKLKIQAAINAAGSSAADVAAPWAGGVYYKQTTTTVSTKTSASSSGSVAMMVVGTSTSATYFGTVDASVLPATKPYISLVAKGNSASSLDCAAIFEAHGTRYQQEAMLDVLA